MCSASYVALNLRIIEQVQWLTICALKLQCVRQMVDARFKSASKEMLQYYIALRIC